MIYGSKLPRLRYPFWRLVGMWNKRFNRVWVVYLPMGSSEVFRSRKQAFEYAEIEQAEVEESILNNRLTGRDTIVGARLRQEDSAHNRKLAWLEENLHRCQFAGARLLPLLRAAERIDAGKKTTDKLMSDAFELARELRHLQADAECFEAGSHARARIQVPAKELEEQLKNAIVAVAA